MLFAIHCLDKPDGLEKRLAHHAAHRAYLQEGHAHLVVAGPLVSDDGETMIGSLFLVEVPSRAAAEAFNAQDPFVKEGIWGQVIIRRFDKKTDNR
ncbi:YciI family protein [Acidisoma cellulosilytica]|uniref:YciI family protein n=1 Tax=Acidisoma cellulosilyticum TaxID=2802395 RepID=A0A963Z2E6_9PROT|nr:YciI family protein [Acidisoma cellulosilyticum]MCB8881515.1 YciI family protein [Acidisoma cellulosilyticum]